MTTASAQTNKEWYDKAFVETLNLQPQDLGETLVYNSVAAWDSVGHMALMAALETKFGIVMETDDIIEFSSYLRGMEILAKYEVQF